MMKSQPSPNPRAPMCFVPITDLAKRLGVTTRTLRHYQDQGLIRSQRLARNVRAYDLETVAVVEVIVALREVDLPIAAIREILLLRSEPQAQAMRSALSEVLADKQRQIIQIQNMLEALPPAASEILPRASATACGSPAPSSGDATVV
jgi:DNA-binding transcriptional MerR regulator